MGRIDLDVGAAQPGQLLHFLAHDLDHIGQKAVEGGIGPRERSADQKLAYRLGLVSVIFLIARDGRPRR